MPDRLKFKTWFSESKFNLYNIIMMSTHTSMMSAHNDDDGKSAVFLCGVMAVSHDHHLGHI